MNISIWGINEYIGYSVYSSLSKKNFHVSGSRNDEPIILSDCIILLAHYTTPSAVEENPYTYIEKDSVK